MIQSPRFTHAIGLLIILAIGCAHAGEPSARADGKAAEPDATAQIAQLKAQCQDASRETEKRQAQSSLYERLGGRERIEALVREIVRLHEQNDKIRHMFQDIDTARLKTQVADFMVAGYGGPGEYTGRDMTAAHAHLDITDEHFLSAGSDIKRALGNLGYGEKVTQEVMCSLMPFHDEVVGG